MGEKRFQKIERAYNRSREKNEFLTTLDEEYYDPLIESCSVGGGDPGIAALMASALEEERHRAHDESPQQAPRAG